jgi:hypothetical protein
MTTRSTTLVTLGAAALLGWLACGEDKSGNNGSGGAGGGSATGGAGGAAKGGSGGSATGGASGSGGAATGGASGSGGAATGGASGSGGSSGMDAAAGDGAKPDTATTSDGATASDTASGGSDGSTGAASAKMSFFVTSETSMTGNLGGLMMADAKCARLAMAAGVTGKTWKAYLSTTMESARSRIGMGPWFNFKGEMIAMNLMQLHEEGGMKNNLTQATALTDKGGIVPGRTLKPPGSNNNEHDILTGSNMDGSLKMGSNCTDWTSAMGDSWVGHGDRMGVQADPVVAMSWNSAHGGMCANTTPGGGAGRFYCFATN